MWTLVSIDYIFSVGSTFGPKIYNGNRARRLLTTYQAGIYNRIDDENSIKMGQGKHPICGGAVLTENYIVTAAHCISTTNTSQYYIILGDYNITDKYDGQEIFEVAEIKIHPGYSKVSQQPNDIALFKLSTTAKINDKIGQICLPSQSG